MLAERLDLSPEQEEQAHDSVRAMLRELRLLGDQAKDSRHDLGDVFGSERLDEARLGELFARHDELLGRARELVVKALGELHELLDPGQREELARLIGRRGSFGPYRA